METSSFTRFQSALAAEYSQRFETDPDYAFSASRTTPSSLAEKMTRGLLTGSASKDGPAIKAVCKALGIANTYTAIKAFLA